MHILIVDDEPVVASTLGQIFRQSGFEAVTVLSVDEALSAIRNQSPDLLLCDINMPGRDGISLMEEVGRELPGCPILVLTGYYSALPRVHACAELLTQAVSIVTKPCQPDELLRTAGAMLRVA